MSHEIEIGTDQVFTHGERAWHRLDENHETPLNKDIISPLFIPLIEGQASVNIDGIETPLEGWKTVVADTRESEIEGDFRPIHVARDRYEILQNEVLFDALQESLDGIPHEVVSAGTLGGLAYFFASVKFTEDYEVKLPDGSECKAYFSLFTSHNGTKNANYYDTTHRTVCMNTLRSSFDSRGEHGFKLGHTKNANVRIHDMAKIVNNVLLGRRQFEEKMGELYSIDCDISKAEKFTAGFFAEKTNAKETLSTRTKNQVDEVVRLAWNGKGNKGDNLFYLAQGATEFWTTGLGTGGESRDTGRKAFSADFGTGMDQKTAFLRDLTDSDKRQKHINRGEKVLLSV